MTPPDIDLTEDEEKHGKLEAGGIEPRTLELEATLNQALARLGKIGLAPCLLLRCQYPGLAQLVEVGPQRANTKKQSILNAVIPINVVECQLTPACRSIRRMLGVEQTADRIMMNVNQCPPWTFHAAMAKSFD